ncbi:sulfur oxidation c-type cytochrome SoxX [Pseudothauera lacus]|uniref:Sulfur oxidation c-type cytochrome SoxX n=1 Tax=Pseudothauera lacus TaxID=2136175 RepID=A0A2T4IE62_9RHOO|nr:sulfur oxidation c-type cytochrome SoxX [Pseudothauera lacus]PTD96061.1 sulfur oxidation c-type cytochrome SoxX [Pseudothauera lacus]
MSKKAIAPLALTVVLAALLAGCVKHGHYAPGASATPAAGAADQALEARVEEMMLTSFKATGIASLDRQVRDEVQKACSSPVQPDAETMRRLEEGQMATIQWPSNGDFTGGDWKEGARIAISGRGLTWTDASPDNNGGGCYNCHAMDPGEVSAGTIGPSLVGYARLRGNSEEIVRYTWGKLWNAKAYNACSNMPRNGYGKILTETQIRHLMAYLFDPASPVNK